MSGGGGGGGGKLPELRMLLKKVFQYSQVKFRGIRCVSKERSENVISQFFQD